MQAIIFALISFIGWGAGDIFGTIAARKIGGLQTSFWYVLLQGAIFGIVGLFFLDNLKNITLGLFLFNILLGILGTIGVIALYEGLKIGNASLVVSISTSFTAITTILSIIFLGETLNIFQAVSVIVIFTGITISTLELKELKKGRVTLSREILLGIIAMLTWGFYWAFIKIPIKEIGWAWPSFIACLSLPIIPLFARARKIKLGIVEGFKKARTTLILQATIMSAAALCFNIAISLGKTSIVAPITGSYPILFVMLAAIFFKDPIKKQQIVGITTTLIGIAALSFASA